MTMDDNHVRIFDTTLRDGEQSPGFSMSIDQKVRMAKALDALGVDIIEAGFANASPADFSAIQKIAAATERSTVCALSRCHSEDIRAAARALSPTPRGRIHVFVATSPIHRIHKLKMSQEEVLQTAIKGVKEAREYCVDVEFSAEDAIRTERDFLAKVLEAAIDAGASTVNVPDTVGYTTPAEIADLFGWLKQNVPNIDRAVLSAHCHNDLGLAVANSLAAVDAGARQIECTINGIGERAGNCSLEEAVMALQTRKDYFELETQVDTTQLFHCSRMLAGITGSIIPRNKAVVGENAFAHESGIHQHGMINHRETYEIMAPEKVGRTHSQLVLGKHSGRHALRQRVEELGFRLDDEAINDLFQRFKQLADRKRYVSDADIEALATGSAAHSSEYWTLKSFRVNADAELASAAVVLTDTSGKDHSEAAVGDGPVDATLKAMQRAVDHDVHVRALTVRSVTEGQDAQGEAELRASFSGQEFSGRATSTDIVEASARAFLQILNRIERQVASPAVITNEPRTAEVING